MRRDALRLQDGFPFDMINFGSRVIQCFTLKKNFLKHLINYLNFKKGIDEFLIFSTTPVRLNDPILKLFSNDFKQNIKDHEAIKKVSNDVLKTIEFDKNYRCPQKACNRF